MAARWPRSDVLEWRHFVITGVYGQIAAERHTGFDRTQKILDKAFDELSIDVQVD